MAGCNEIERISDEQINHRIAYKDSWDNIDEDKREQMSDEEIEKYYKDPEGERRFDEENKRAKCVHLLQCTDERCVSLKGLWESEPMLAKDLEKYGNSGETPKDGGN